jgi:alpha-L-fucosidase
MAVWTAFGLVSAQRLFPCVAAGTVEAVEGSPVLPSAAQLAWQDLEFGVLVRYGMNAFLGGEADHQRDATARFDPAELDPYPWARAAADAGARLLMVTVKERDGFCLWPSRMTEYSVRASPWRDGQGDLLREVSAACRSTGLRLGLWYPLHDRHEPTAANPAAYNEFLQGQLAELLIDYGEVAELWLDGGTDAEPGTALAGVDLGALLGLARHLQPRMLVTGVGPDARSLPMEAIVIRDQESSVQPVGSEPWWARLFPGRDQVWRPVERLVNLRPSSFYRAREDGRLLSVTQLTEVWLDSVGHNASLLLSVPATPSGRIAAPDVRRLREFGAAIRPLSTNTLPETSGTGDQVLLLLKPPREVAAIVAQEDLGGGERIQRFVLETREPGETEWRVVHEGRVLGHKRIVEFNPRLLEAIRLRTLKSSDSPMIRQLAVVPAP